MTSTEIISVIGAVGILIGILSPAIISVIKAMGELRTIVTRVDAKADVISAVAAKIDGHVNSEKTAGEGRENTLRAEIVILREMLSDKKQAALLLAQAAAGASTTVVHKTNGGAAPTTSTAETSLDKIEENTSKIETNTASTEATVQKLEDKA